MEDAVARRPSLRQLEYLIAIAECRHFGAAAKKAAVSQPTMSLQLRALEDAVGTRLVDRNRNNVSLTHSGTIVAQRAQEILLQIDELIAAVSRDQKNLGGLIRLGTAPTVGPYLLPRIVPRLHADFPALRIYIREELPTRLATFVADGSIDLALIALPAHDDRLHAVEIAQERLLIGMARDHPLARLRSLPPERLAGQKFLTLGRSHRLYEEVERLAARHGAGLLEDYEGTSLDALRQMVALGMGLSVFPANYAASEIGADRSVVLRPLAGQPLVRSLGFVWRSGAVRTPDFITLASFARESLRARGRAERD
jgi:LysR family transcriptional regulator, hydrogen peroxide-inducible genes activator